MITSELIPVVLEKIRNRYQNIRLLTLDVLSECDTEAIPELIRNREELLSAISADKESITGALVPHETSDRILILQNEIQGIIRTIGDLDKQLEKFIQGNVTSLSSELSNLFCSSRAASAYATQSRR